MGMPSISSTEGQANVRRARETLKPGDIVWYPGTDTLSLVVVIRIDKTAILVHGLYPYNTGRATYLFFHGDWELVGYDASLLAIDNESEAPDGST